MTGAAGGVGSVGAACDAMGDGHPGNAAGAVGLEAMPRVVIQVASWLLVFLALLTVRALRV